MSGFCLCYLDFGAVFKIKDKTFTAYERVSCWMIRISVMEQIVQTFPED